MRNFVPELMRGIKNELTNEDNPILDGGFVVRESELIIYSINNR